LKKTKKKFAKFFFRAVVKQIPILIAGNICFAIQGSTYGRNFWQKEDAAKHLN
jgi:hypothetical protein